MFSPRSLRLDLHWTNFTAHSGLLAPLHISKTIGSPNLFPAGVILVTLCDRGGLGPSKLQTFIAASPALHSGKCSFFWTDSIPA